MGLTIATLVIFIFLVLFITIPKPVYGECCGKATFIYMACPHIYDKCGTFICMDGTPVGLLEYCGHGRCNMFGCNCDGGCRTNPSGTTEEAQNLFEKLYDVRSLKMGTISQNLRYK